MNPAIKGQYFYHNRTLKSINFLNNVPDDNSVSIYEVFRVDQSVALFINDHIERLSNSANIADKKLNISNSQLLQGIYTLIAANKIINGNIKLDFRYNVGGKCEFMAYELVTHYPTGQQLSTGVSTCFQGAERHHPNAKIFNAAVRGQANDIIEKAHVYDTILVNHFGQMTEGSRSNLFFIINETIITAPDEVVLPGIIRMKVIDIIKANNIKLELRALSCQELEKVEGAFLTGTSPRLLPLKSIEGFQFNVQLPLITRLMTELNKLILLYIDKHR